ncbi:unnamed protein product [Moneuplotes crassus]|uniref:Uncharacterized protein n=1 Tax=Euplotes crassus TaxID=5936 RepID=A0AAD2D9G8_EUPCR|nr:unnamed protein product [Moneuplotes crassus]
MSLSRKSRQLVHSSQKQFRKLKYYNPDSVPKQRAESATRHELKSNKDRILASSKRVIDTDVDHDFCNLKGLEFPLNNKRRFSVDYLELNAPTESTKIEREKLKYAKPRDKSSNASERSVSSRHNSEIFKNLYSKFQRKLKFKDLSQKNIASLPKSIVPSNEIPIMSKPLKLPAPSLNSYVDEVSARTLELRKKQEELRLKRLRIDLMKSLKSTKIDVGAPPTVKANIRQLITDLKVLKSSLSAQPDTVVMKRGNLSKFHGNAQEIDAQIELLKQSRKEMEEALFIAHKNYKAAIVDEKQRDFEMSELKYAAEKVDDKLRETIENNISSYATEVTSLSEELQNIRNDKALLLQENIEVDKEITQEQRKLKLVIPLDEQNGMYLFILNYLDQKLKEANQKVTLFQNVMEQTLSMPMDEDGSKSRHMRISELKQMLSFQKNERSKVAKKISELYNYRIDPEDEMNLVQIHDENERLKEEFYQLSDHKTKRAKIAHMLRKCLKLNEIIMEKECDQRRLEAEIQVEQLSEDPSFYIKTLERLEMIISRQDSLRVSISELGNKCLALSGRLTELDNLIRYLQERYRKMRIDPLVEYNISEKVDDKVKVYRTIEKITEFEFEERKSIMQRQRKSDIYGVSPTRDEFIIRTPGEQDEIIRISDSYQLDEGRRTLQPENYFPNSDFTDDLSDIGDESSSIQNHNRLISKKKPRARY